MSEHHRHSEGPPRRSLDPETRPPATPPPHGLNIRPLKGPPMVPIKDAAEEELAELEAELEEE